MWALHSTASDGGTDMHMFSSSGHAVTQAIGGEGLGTFDVGWLEKRRAQIFATRKKAAGETASPSQLCADADCAAVTQEDLLSFNRNKL